MPAPRAVRSWDLPVTFAASGCAYLGIIGIPPFSALFTKDPIIEAAYARAGSPARCWAPRR